jgi:hypothetical protein
MAALLIADELWDARVALAEKAVAANEPVNDAAKEPISQPANQPVREAAAERREQEAIRAEHRRRVTAPVEG